jgi:hypothetical protein
MIEAHLSPAALAAGVGAPSLALVRRIAVVEGCRQLDGELKALAALPGGAALARIASGSPLPAADATLAEGWLPDGAARVSRTATAIDAETVAGDPVGFSRDNIRDACLIASAESGLPMVVHDARAILEHLAVDIVQERDSRPAIGLSTGRRPLSRISAAGCAVEASASLCSDTTYLLLFVPGNSRTDAAATRAVCIRAIRLMRRSCPQVYAQIVPVHPPREDREPGAVNRAAAG